MLIRCLPFLAAALASVSCCAVSAEPLRTATAWMAETQPYARAAIERHFGKVEWRCAGVPGAFECMASGDGVAMRWRADEEEGAARNGHASLRLAGCMGRREVERVLGAPLRFGPDSVHERSPTVTLAARYWIPGRAWNVAVTFAGDCAGKLTMSELPF